ncbi:MAG TPA: branched-chain amino acid ABC transporter permease, partial [Anaerolineales bacterium]
LVQVVIVGFLTGGVYALMSAGLTLIFGVMKVINIAHGAFLVLSAYIAYWLFTLYGLEPFLSIVVSVPVFFLIGLLVQRFMLAKVRGEAGLTVLLTFSLALVIEGLIGWLWQSTGRSIRTWYTSEIIPIKIAEVSVRLPVVRLVGFVLAAIALLALYLLLNRTDPGRAIRATIQNRDAARLVGVSVDRIQALTFGLGLATVAGGGALFSVIWTFNAGSHEEWISKMLSIIVLGGMGSLPGAFLAALIMGMVESVAAVTMTSYISPIVFYLILFVTLVFRPQGLLGARIREG